MARKPAPKPKKSDPKQYRRFVEAAAVAEASESPEAFERAFKRVVIPKKPAKGGGA